jgi:hypothetical protein
MYRIMLVDDEEYVLSALRRNLALLGYELETFSQPRQALTRAGEVSFDLVISDYRMPDMDGVALIKELKKIQPNLVAVMLTGFIDLRSIMNEINDAGIYRILTKPCDTDKLNATISEALGQRARDGDTQTPRVPVLTVPKPKGALAALEAKYPGITQPESDHIPTY